MTDQIHTYHNALLAFSLKLTKNMDDAEDLLNDTYLRALTRKAQFKEGTNLKGWLFTIMHSIFLNNCKRFRNSESLFAVVHYAVKPMAELRIEFKQVTEGIEKLKPNLKEALMMHVEGYSYDEIAQRQQAPLGTVKSRVSLARQRLKAIN
jgi:RNA polymerase sigma-70 factor (ECF subfamily)